MKMSWGFWTAPRRKYHEQGICCLTPMLGKKEKSLAARTLKIRYVYSQNLYFLIPLLCHQILPIQIPIHMVGKSIMVKSHNHWQKSWPKTAKGCGQTRYKIGRWPRLPRRIESKDPNRDLYTYIHSSTSHYSQKTEKTQMPINGWMAKENVVHTHTHSHPHRNIIQPWKVTKFQHMLQYGKFENMVLHERSQTEKDKHCLILFGMKKKVWQ